MKQVALTPLEKPIIKEVKIPGSLSYTTRALLLAAMTEGEVKIIGPVKSDDSYTMVHILQTLGIAITEEKNSFVVSGNIKYIQNKEYLLSAHISGRTARSILAFLTIVPGVKILTCKEAFKKRPVGDLVDGLRLLGAQIEYLENTGYLPVKITSSKLYAGTAKITGTVSSQYVSAIMMISPLIGDIVIETIGTQSSKPFIDITIDIMKTFGVIVQNEQYKKYRISGNQNYINPKKYLIEADAIAASYFWAIAALTKSSIKILNLSPDSKQGDVAFADILEQMGCVVRKNSEEKWIEVKGSDRLSGITIDMNHMPDTAVTLAVICAFAKGQTRISNISHIKTKETDRINAPLHELKKMGVTVEATTDTLTIQGGIPHAAIIDTYGDHRIAMAFATSGSKIPGMVINNPDVVNKSFTHFWNTLEKIGIKTKIYEQ